MSNRNVLQLRFLEHCGSANGAVDWRQLIAGCLLQLFESTFEPPLLKGAAVTGGGCVGKFRKTDPR